MKLNQFIAADVVTKKEIHQPKYLEIPENLLSIGTHGLCFDESRTIQLFHIGVVESYKIDQLVVDHSNPMNIVLKWNSRSSNGTIEGLGRVRFCNKGAEFKYHLYAQDTRITVLRGRSVSPVVQWSNLINAFPNLGDTNEISLWKHVYDRLQISHHLLFTKIRWYNFWNSRNESWSFFKAVRSSQTTTKLSKVGGKQNKELNSMIFFDNFEAVADSSGQLNVHRASFKTDVETLLRLVLHEEVVRTLNTVFPLKRMKNFIKLNNPVRNHIENAIQTPPHPLSSF